MGLGLAFGGCECEVTLREDGFTLPTVPVLSRRALIEFVLTDPTFPFKSRNPRKIWLMPDAWCPGGVIWTAG